MKKKRQILFCDRVNELAFIDLDQCAKVSKRVRQICLDDTLKYNEFLLNEWMTGKFPKVHALNTPLAVDMPQSKPWHKSFIPELRNCMVFRL